jgi:fumarate hydratase subunit alpha
MKTVSSQKIRLAVAAACRKAAFLLRKDVRIALGVALDREKNPRIRRILEAIIENARSAEIRQLAICQDTGMPVVFAEVGQDVKIQGDFRSAVNQGVADGYLKNYLRESVVSQPLERRQPKYSPAVIHTELVPGSKIKITVLPKGFGCENKSQLKMFNPTAGIEEIKQFVVEAVKAAGPDACPPYVVGVGIGGTADYASVLAKKALLRSVLPGKRSTGKTGKLERELLGRINELKIGPMGLGGKTTALAVNIASYPTHIAGLPVAVNISCHALRSASVTL